MEEGQRIVLIDDDPNVLEATATVLTLDGYAVFSLNDPSGALAFVREIGPDLVLLDRTMGDIDGIDICREIKEDPLLQNVLVVHLSGNKVTTDQQALGLETGADGYIVRPISNRELRARVRTYMRTKAAEDRLRASESKFRSVVEQAGEGLVIVDAGGRVTEWNREMEQISGLSRAAVTGRPVWEIESELMPQELRTEAAESAVRGLWQRFIDADSEAKRVIERQIVTASGQQRILDICYFTIRSNGDTQAAAIVRDITERRRAAARIEHLGSELQDTLEEVKVLSGLLPICASCKAIRNDEGYWEQLEEYIRKHSDAQFTHGLCPRVREAVVSRLHGGAVAGRADPGITIDVRGAEASRSCVGGGIEPAWRLLFPCCRSGTHYGLRVALCMDGPTPSDGQSFDVIGTMRLGHGAAAKAPVLSEERTGNRWAGRTVRGRLPYRSLTQSHTVRQGGESSLLGWPPTPTLSIVAGRSRSGCHGPVRCQPRYPRHAV